MIQIQMILIHHMINQLIMEQKVVVIMQQNLNQNNNHRHQHKINQMMMEQINHQKK